MKLTVDIVVQRGDQFLFIRRKFPPFQGELALPGGFVEENETTEEAACRELFEETGIAIDQTDLRLIGVFSKPKRDPRGRTVSVAYHCSVPEHTQAKAGDDAASLVWAAATNEPLAFDHQWILESAL